jgi:glyoxylase-like metal-dependent hydrolase (beta-lactamase superfamily II)
VIEWRRVVDGPQGLRIYRIDAEARGLGGLGLRFDPVAAVLSAEHTPTTRRLLETFSGHDSPVGPSSFRVACHVVSVPGLVLVVDSTFGTTAPEVFPGALEVVLASEGARLRDRPVRVLYTHAHFDHAGGHESVEAMGDAVTTLGHPHSRALQPWVGRRDSFFATKGQFFRDCEISRPLEELREEVRDLFHRMLESNGVDASSHPYGTGSEEPIRIDLAIEPTGERAHRLDDRIEVLRFDGHIPGHLCVRVAGDHLITGDMWLPATTSTVTPGTIAEAAGVPREACGIARYLESSERLLGMDVDDCISYPSHENIFRNPKRMAMRDLELFAERFDLIDRVLAEHRRRPMRVLDLAWGGADHLPLWKLNSSKQRLLVAHDEACAYLQDLVAFGDLREVEPERYVWTGTTALRSRVLAGLEQARSRHGHLEFRSRAAGVHAGA